MRNFLIAAIVALAAVGVYFTQKPVPQPVPSVKPFAPIERGEAISAPVEPAPAVESLPSEAVTGDAVLASIAPDQRTNSRGISIWNPDTNAPKREKIIFEPSRGGPAIAPDIKDEEALSELEKADRLKLEKEEALTFTDDNSPLPKIGEYTLAKFSVLANFRFDIKTEMLTPGENPEIVAAAISRQIPQRVRDLHEKQVAVQGFMMPVTGSFGEWSEFLLVRNRANCCYGKTPKANEWIMVKTAGKGVPYIEDEVVTVFGTLRVGDIRQSGSFTGIYEMNCEKAERADKVKAK